MDQFITQLHGFTQLLPGIPVKAVIKAYLIPACEIKVFLQINGISFAVCTCFFFWLILAL